MSNQSTKTYVGKGKKHESFDLTNISIEKTQVEQFWKSHKNGKSYLNLTVGGLRQTDQFGNTHSVWVDDYKPKVSANEDGGTVKEKDLPFDF